MGRLTYLLLAAMMLPLIGLAACQPGLNGRPPEGPPRTHHAVHSERLRNLMGEVHAAVQRSWPQEIQQEKKAEAQRDREAQLRRAARLASFLADSAQAIPDAIADVDLPPAERDQFNAKAYLLEQQALALQQRAERGDVDRMRAILADVKTTCTGCHDQFAELAGPIEFGNGQ